MYKEYAGGGSETPTAPTTRILLLSPISFFLYVIVSNKNFVLSYCNVNNVS